MPQLFRGSHSISRPGVVNCWVSSKSFLIRLLMIEMGEERSENLLEPGTMTLFSLGVHLSNILSIKLFHIVVPLKTKLCLEISSLCRGTRIVWLHALELVWNKLVREIG